MENSKNCCQARLGGILGGIGMGAILAAALEQFTKYNLKNYTTLTMAAGLVAIAAGFMIARTRRSPDKPEQL